jgi:predicted enzyme related to lactoylglutathione lyase
VNNPVSATQLRIVFAAFFIALFANCASLNIDLPPVTESPGGERLPGKIIWHDLLTNDPAASQAFYGELFGWEFKDIGIAVGLNSDSAYTQIRHNGRLIGGMIDTLAVNGRVDISQWVVSMSVSDIDAAVAAVTAEGGDVITPPTDLQRRGRIAVVRDKEGALLAMLQTASGDPADRQPEFGDFLWNELWTTNADSATTFYEGLTGLKMATWDVDENQESGATYRLLKAGETPRVGIMPNPLEDLGPVWVSYLRVKNPASIAERASELGGRVIVEAQPRPLGGEVAFIAGPSGAGIALQTWPLDRAN